MKQASFVVIAGSMFSGKTGELIRQVERARIAHRAVWVFSPKVDARVGDGKFYQFIFSLLPWIKKFFPFPKLVSHDGFQTRTRIIDTATDILSIGITEGLIAIDEAQFFGSDLPNVCLTLLDKGIDVVVAGLDKDSRGEPFGVMPTLLALAHQVVKLSAVCVVCGEDAQYTHRIGNDARQVLVGGKESYDARCRQCWVFIE